MTDYENGYDHALLDIFMLIQMWVFYDWYQQNKTFIKTMDTQGEREEALRELKELIKSTRMIVDYCKSQKEKT